MTILGAVIPFASHCGIVDLGPVEGILLLWINPDRHHFNNSGIVHGGAICTLLDVAIGSIARINAGSAVLTLDMHVIDLAALRGAFTAEGRVIRAGGQSFAPNRRQRQKTTRSSRDRLATSSQRRNARSPPRRLRDALERSSMNRACDFSRHCCFRPVTNPSAPTGGRSLFTIVHHETTKIGGCQLSHLNCFDLTFRLRP